MPARMRVTSLTKARQADLGGEGEGKMTKSESRKPKAERATTNGREWTRMKTGRQVRSGPKPIAPLSRFAQVQFLPLLPLGGQAGPGGRFVKPLEPSHSLGQPGLAFAGNLGFALLHTLIAGEQQWLGFRVFLLPQQAAAP